MSTTLRVPESVRARAAALSRESGVSIGSVIAQALDAYEKAEFWRQTREALATADSASTVDEAADPAWERTVRDGLERE